MGIITSKPLALIRDKFCRSGMPRRYEDEEVDFRNGESKNVDALPRTVTAVKGTSYSFDGTGTRTSGFDEESRRTLRWLAFSRPRVVFGFDHLGAINLPNISNHLKGLALCFERVSGWHVPVQIFQDVESSACEFRVQLSLSMFHLNSNTYFGSTWMGDALLLNDEINEYSVQVDIPYNEIVYMISRLNDPSCVGVVEIVVSKISKKGLVIGQYGLEHKLSL